MKTSFITFYYFNVFDSITGSSSDSIKNTKMLNQRHKNTKLKRVFD